MRDGLVPPREEVARTAEEVSSSRPRVGGTEGRAFLRGATSATLEFLPHMAIISAYAAGCAIIVARTGTSEDLTLVDVLRDSAYWFAVGGIITLVVSSVLFVWGDRHARRGRSPGDRDGAGPLARWRAHLASRFDGRRVGGAAAGVLLVVVFLKLFLVVKTALPLVHPFTWDPTLHAVDRALALGHDPWRLLQPILGHPLATRALDDVYALWYLVIMGTLLWQLWSPRHALRSRFLLAFILCWAVIGSIMAIAFSSAGPAYYGLVVGHPDPYAPLMRYLRGVNAGHPVTALRIQRYLWQGYEGTAVHAVEGISAMPSMHISMAVLATLVAARYHRVLAIPYGAFVVLVFLGSIELGWHYAVDGYVAVAVTLLCWWGAGLVTDRFESAIASSRARCPRLISRQGPRSDDPSRMSE